MKPIIVTGVRADDRSQDVDSAFFRKNPNTTEYIRDQIAGESPEPLPPGTRVHVKRIGATRMRAFVSPPSKVN